jgi:bifunctional DNA-binding transcriptional regulator/antitoxin component of YhaV-PrlF toxin-antitoxin module
MSATAIREKRQTTIPEDVSQAAGLKPGDQVDWRFEDGEIRGRKLVPGKRGGSRVQGP